MSISPLLAIGIATSGVADAYNKGVDLKQARQDRRDTALQRKKVGDLKLQQMQNTVNNIPLANQQLQQQVQQQQLTLQNLQKETLRKGSFSVLDDLFESGDPRTANQFLQDNKDNEQIHTAFNNAIHLTIIDPNSNEDKQLLQQMGLSQAELDARDGTKDGKVDWEKLKKRFFKVTTSDGKVYMADMVNTAGGMGYAKHARDASFKNMKALADIAKVQKGDKGTALQQNSKAYGEAKARIASGAPQPGDQAIIDRTDALNRPPAPKAPPAAPAQERLAIDAAKAQKEIDAGDNSLKNRNIVTAYKHEIAGVGTGKVALATQARKDYVAAGYDKLSVAELKANPAAVALVEQIEAVHPITSGTQKAMTDLNAMVALSKEAGNLSSTQTGLFDSMISTATNYISDDTIDKKAKSAYGAFINQFRHNLFGSTLTEGELTAFREAYSTNSQKIGPVLSGLRAALIQVQSKLKTISGFNAPEVIKLRGGTGLADVTEALKNVNERLDFYDKVASGMTPDEALKAIKPNKPLAPADISTKLGF